MNTRLPYWLASAGLALLIGTSTTALADRVQIPVGQQSGSASTDQLPRNGMEKSQVAQQFGEPQEREGAVGEPPISRWEYEHYVVYFEHDRVLRSVLKHSPQGSGSYSNN